jgi:flagellin-specific chaperone FliS
VALRPLTRVPQPSNSAVVDAPKDPGDNHAAQCMTLANACVESRPVHARRRAEQHGTILPRLMQIINEKLEQLNYKYKDLNYITLSSLFDIFCSRLVPGWS